MTNYQQDTLALIPGTTPREKYEALQLILLGCRLLKTPWLFAKNTGSKYFCRPICNTTALLITKPATLHILFNLTALLL